MWESGSAGKAALTSHLWQLFRRLVSFASDVSVVTQGGTKSPAVPEVPHREMSQGIIKEIIAQTENSNRSLRGN